VVKGEGTKNKERMMHARRALVKPLPEEAPGAGGNNRAMKKSLGEGKGQKLGQEEN